MWLFSRLSRELGHYKRLSPESRRLFLSSLLYELTGPIAFVFTNAFLFRSSDDPILVSMYSLGWIVSIGFGFYLNGFLLRYFSLSRLFGIGAVLQGVVGVSLFYLPTLSNLSVLLFGMIFGIPMGIYWANRNFLALDTTDDAQRVYYGGLEQVMATAVEITVPLLIGVVLSFSAHTGILSITLMYRVFALVAVGLHIINAFVISTLKVPNPPVKKLFLWNVSRQWKKVRTAEIFLGILNGVWQYVPTLIVLTFLGAEGTLGILASLSAILGAIAVYTVTRTTRESTRVSRYGMIIGVHTLVALGYAVFYSQPMAVFFLLVSQPLIQLAWPLQQAVISKTIEDEEGGSNESNYAYVCDEEFFLNIGRMLGIGLFFILSTFIFPENALRYIPVLVISAQVVVWVIIKSLSKKHYEN